IKNKVFSSESNFNSFYFQFLELEEYISFKNRTILDIGCGNGNFLIMCSLFEKASNCIGIDSVQGKGSEKDSLKIFQQKINLLNLDNVKYIKSDIFKYDFEDKQFDIITANFSLHHIIETTKNFLSSQELINKSVILFNKIYKLLKPNGVFLVKEVSKYNLSRYFPIHGKIFGLDNINWKSKHLPSEYIVGLKKAKFKNVGVIYSIPYLIKKYGFLRFKKLLTNPIANFFFSSTYYIIARK
ncbi:MAG: class I SAM-dependent methyltransferase, partial [Candidatus Lokiarchaeia archaeon]